jgi:hypothetical protein
VAVPPEALEVISGLGSKPESRRFVLMLVVAFLPAAVPVSSSATK